LYEQWDSILRDLADEIERSLASAKRQFPEFKVRQLWGLGGGFRLHGVLRSLTSPADR